MKEAAENNCSTGLEIAIIGMSGRFPGAKNLDQYWENLKNGVESIWFFSDEELKNGAVEPELLKEPDYVKTAGGVMEDQNREYFDALFFGYQPAEAEIMDPQMRIIHECTWEALENAGYNPDIGEYLIGLYMGAGDNFFWRALTLFSQKVEALGELAASLLSDKDYLATRLAYKLNLKGPAVLVKTACSTSLVAIHLACQGLLNSECDLAAAGGVTLKSLKAYGYLYNEGMIVSPDGHCRAFDAKAKGLTEGEGVGVVVLKILEDAHQDRDHIHAVIKSTAVNNDGNRKAGYTAPSIIGQAETIRVTHKLAGIEPESIGYIETHGTGTTVGDPIEIEALKLAFNTDKKGFCRIGSVKTNIGHLDAAAGVAALIKTVLCLKYQCIPPSLHFETPNPRIDLENSPFSVNTKLWEWKNSLYPRRAGVSSFGIGGTNAHVVLEEAPIPQSAQPQSQSAGREYQLILLSARTESALDKMTINLTEYFKKNPLIHLADAAYTLQLGRKAFQYRKMAVCSDIDEAITAFSAPDSRNLRQWLVKEVKPPVIFVFAGLGSQYVNMGAELYQKVPVFRREMDHCFEILKSLMGHDIKGILYPPHTPPFGHPSQEGKELHATMHPCSHASSEKINETHIAQLAIFIVEYSLARLLMEWGVTPHSMIGYSFGEYTAACLAGVFSLEDALRIIVMRGQLIRELPAGGMLSVPLPRDQLQPFLNEGYTELSIAIDNGPSCVVAGPAAIIDDFEKQMKENRYICVGLHTSHALHSPMMEPVLKRFQENMSGFALNKNQIPYISNVTGKWISGEQAADPAYWSTHFRETVRFADGIKELLKEPHSIFVEIGPGYDLSVLLRHHPDVKNESDYLILNLLKHSQSDVPDCRYLMNKIGRLWLQGVNFDWPAFCSREKPCRIPLPSYPFEGQRYWIDGNPLRIGAEMLAERSMANKKTDISQWMYIPSWKRSEPPLPKNKKREIPGKSCWLVFMDEFGLGSQVVKQLKQEGQEVIAARVGKAFNKTGEQEYTLNPGHPGDYNALLKECRKQNKLIDKVMHLWNVTKENEIPARKKEEVNFSSVDAILDLGFYSLLFFVQATGKEGFRKPLQMLIVSNYQQKVNGEEELCPAKAAAIGAVKVIPKEYHNISCRSIDIILPDTGSSKRAQLIHRLREEFSIESLTDIIAYRGDYRWEQIFEPVQLEKAGENISRLKNSGVYLVTGGLGGIGFVLAKNLAEKAQARLVLTGRSAFPKRETWDQWLDTHPENDSTSIKIKKVRELESIGSKVLVCSADAASPEQMREVITTAQKRLGPINGVIHAAGLPDGCMIPLRTKKETNEIMAPKLKGTLVLQEVLKEFKPDFFVICSSLSTILGPFGQIGYCAANAFQDSFAHYNNDTHQTFTVSINWDTWQEVGMGIEVVKQLMEKENVADAQFLLEHGILPAEGTDVFNRILEQAYSQVAVSTRDLEFAVEQAKAQASAGPREEIPGDIPSKTLYPRPQLSTEYVPPATDFEKIYTDILQNFLGFDRVGIHDNIFEFGITSLAVIHINSILKKKIKKDIPVVVMFEFPTIHALENYFFQEEAEERLDNTNNLEQKERLMQNTMSILRGED